MNNFGISYDSFNDWGAYCTDLAVERRKTDTDIQGITYERRGASVGGWEEIRITSPLAAKKIGKPEGSYYTLSLPKIDTLDNAEAEDASDELARALCRLCDEGEIIPERILIVGLGNRRLTPDALGPKSAEIIKPTSHIKDTDKECYEELDCSEISVITPGVTSKTGIETFEIVKGVARRVMPSLVIVIDSIATRSVERLGSTVQICNTGIHPGGAMNHSATPINEDTLGVPVISIGIPTVIDARAFGNGYTKEGMLVSPREIDEITELGAKIIGDGINQAFGFF